MVLVKLFHSWKSGSNLGKGMKSSRAGNFINALEYFQNALYHAEKTNNIGDIALSWRSLLRPIIKWVTAKKPPILDQKVWIYIPKFKI